MLAWIVAVLTLAALWAIIYLLKWKLNLGKWGITVEHGMLMWRTKKGLKLIDRVARASKRNWRTLGTLGIMVGLILMALTFSGFVMRAIDILKGVQVVGPAVSLVIPGITIPLWEGLIAVFTVLVVHEFSHGILLRAQGLATKTVGVLLLIAIPGAFVEPDERKLKKSPVLKRLRVYSAGPFANVVFGFLILFILLLLISPKPGVYVWAIQKGGPSENMINVGDRLIEINGTPFQKYTNYYYYEDYYNIMKKIKVGENVTVKTDKGVFVIKAGKHWADENLASLGLFPFSATPRTDFVNPLKAFEALSFEFMGYSLISPIFYDSLLPWQIISLLKWVFILNLGIGVFNLMPAIPLDGGYIVSGIIEKFSSAKIAKRITYALSFLFLALLLINFVPTFA
jgi:membrane-associated protease RseP (regulator of RpoE activity)